MMLHSSSARLPQTLSEDLIKQQASLIAGCCMHQMVMFRTFVMALACLSTYCPRPLGGMHSSAPMVARWRWLCKRPACLAHSGVITIGAVQQASDIHMLAASRASDGQGVSQHLTCFRLPTCHHCLQIKRRDR